VDDELDAGLDASLDESAELEASEAEFAESALDQSAEINIEALLSQLESQGPDSKGKISGRRRLEDFIERKRVARELEDFEDFEV
jgi:hypothetical protein